MKQRTTPISFKYAIMHIDNHVEHLAIVFLSCIIYGILYLGFIYILW